MKPTARIAWILVLFFVIVAVAYGFITGTQSPLGIEMVGFPAFLMLALMFAMLGIAVSLASRAHPNRPEEDEHGELASDAGVQGSFAPYSWQPLWLAIGCGLMFLGVAAGWWIFVLGAIPMLVGLLGWIMEFSVGKHAH